MKVKRLRTIFACSAAVALLMSGASIGSGSSLVEAKVVQTKKAFDYKKYRADQLKVITKYGNILSDLSSKSPIKIPSYYQNEAYRTAVEQYNPKVEKYDSDNVKESRKIRAMRVDLKAVDTSSEKKAFDKRMAEMKKEVKRLVKVEQALAKESKPLYQEVIDYERQQMEAFVAQYGPIDPALTLIKSLPYVQEFERKLIKKKISKQDRIERVDRAAEAMVRERETSSERVGPERGKVTILIYENKFEEAAAVFEEAKQLTKDENVRLDLAFKKIINQFLK